MRSVDGAICAEAPERIIISPDENDAGRMAQHDWAEAMNPGSVLRFLEPR